MLTGDVVTENGQKSSSEPKRRKFMNWIKDILRKANRNAFEVSKDGKIILACRRDGPFATVLSQWAMAVAKESSLQRSIIDKSHC